MRSRTTSSSSSRGWLLVALLAALPPDRLTAQDLTATELGLAALVGAREPVAWGGAVSLGRRVTTRQRLAADGALVRRSGVTAGRIRVQGQYLVNPAASRGLAVYAGAGLTFEMREGADGLTWLTAALGLETRPGRPLGLMVELSVGGGVWLAGGARWRRFPGWWNPG